AVPRRGAARCLLDPRRACVRAPRAGRGRGRGRIPARGRRGRRRLLAPPGRRADPAPRRHAPSRPHRRVPSRRRRRARLALGPRCRGARRQPRPASGPLPARPRRSRSVLAHPRAGRDSPDPAPAARAARQRSHHLHPVLTMSESPLFEVELYAFEGMSGSFYLTPHELDVEIDGERYERCPLERSALALGAEAAKSALELKLPPDHALVRHLLQAAITGEATAVRLEVAQYDAWYDDWWFAGTRWMGRVLGVEVADDAARIRCESVQVSLKRIGLRRLYSRACSHVLYSAACGATPIAASATVVQVLGRSVEFDGGAPAAVAGMLAGGWLETEAGARHMIVSE